MKQAATRPPPGLVETPVTRCVQGVWRTEPDIIAEEIPVAFIYNGSPYAVMLASPTDLEDFAYGFSRTEGLIANSTDLLALDIRQLVTGIELRIDIRDQAGLRQAVARALPGPSSCGLCGTRDLEDAIRWPRAVGNGLRVASASISNGLASMRARQTLHNIAGATHAAAWLSAAGVVKLVREDIGRHNALDKLVGAMLKADYTIDGGFVAVTSRASYELVQKAASVGVEMLVAVSAPTALAVRMAASANMTLLGFARNTHFAVYAHPERLTDYYIGRPRERTAGLVA